MVKKENDICPKCGGQLQSRGSVKRLVRYKNGEKILVKVKRYSCKDCKSWHRVLPNYLIPYKHYPKEVIKGFVEGTLTNDILEFEDYPVDITVKRWKSQ